MSKFLTGAALAACVAAVAMASPASAATTSGKHAVRSTDVSAARHHRVYRHHRRTRVVVRPRYAPAYAPGYYAPGYAAGPQYYSYAPGVGPIPGVGVGPFFGLGPFIFHY